jgi:hypothetical protein
VETGLQDGRVVAEPHPQARGAQHPRRQKLQATALFIFEYDNFVMLACQQRYH